VRGAPPYRAAKHGHAWPNRSGMKPAPGQRTRLARVCAVQFARGNQHRIACFGIEGVTRQEQNELEIGTLRDNKSCLPGIDYTALPEQCQVKIVLIFRYTIATRFFLLRSIPAGIDDRSPGGNEECYFQPRARRAGASIWSVTMGESLAAPRLLRWLVSRKSCGSCQSAWLL
jgi:hypothetical protein